MYGFSLPGSFLQLRVFYSLLIKSNLARVCKFEYLKIKLSEVQNSFESMSYLLNEHEILVGRAEQDITMGMCWESEFGMQHSPFLFFISVSSQNANACPSAG